jgi:acyl-CoA thioesterase I
LLRGGLADVAPKREDGQMSLRHRVLLYALLGLPLVALDAANLAHAQVVAFGASNTAGTGPSGGGVMKPEAYPAQLEKLLRARGLGVTVKNAGVPGLTTAMMLSSLDSAVDSGTKVVILNPGVGNDTRLGGTVVDAQRNTAEMVRRLKTRGFKVIVLHTSSFPADTQEGEHYNAKGHAIIAARLLPQVMAALRH